MEKVIKAFREAVKFSTPISANVLRKENGKFISVSSVWSQNNIERKVKMNSEMFQTIDLDSNTVINNGCTENTGYLVSSYSPSSLLRAVVREVPAAGKTPKKQFLEVWKNNLMVSQFDLQSLDIHGDIYTDSDFGSFEWSFCEDYILYVAEKKQPKTESFLSSSKSSENSDKIIKGNEFLYSQDWGEQQVGKSKSVLVIVNLKSLEIKVLNIKEEKEYFYGSGTWASDGSIIAVAYEVHPRRLGRVYCTNRPSFIVRITPDGCVTKLSENGKSVFGPKVSPNGERLIWFQRDVGGPHHSCVCLIRYDLNLKKESTIVDLVSNDIKCTGGQTFYGLYNHMKPADCWLTDNKTVVLSTQQRASVKSYVIDTESGSISEICGAVDEEFSQGVLQVWQDYVICWRSSLQSFPGLYMAKIVPDNLDGIKWITLVPCEDIAENYQVNILRLKGKMDPQSSVKVEDYSAIYFGPKDEIKAPLVVWSHGGPHSASSNIFHLMAHFYTKLGFAMLMVNYRGSIGSGKACVDYLLGKIGSADVSDIHLALAHVLKTVPNIDDKKCLLYGGSHGGFLSLHLAGQHPDDFIGCTALNPVANLTQFSSSDIPDWAFTESSVKYAPLANFSSEEYEKLWKASPQYYVDQVKIPVLLLIGSKDLRVSPSQGINYYYALRESGKVKTKLLLYEDNHSLSKSAHETDFIINTACWFLQATGHISE